ncbi:aspartate aminotransferase family protein [Sedimentitalea todarodis]|uniref:Aspartate aminotransferase family protein n=1 Tax=Sedimentitalea todarodis TaxID=1631240 RepID=A0ABU3VCQ5_9RHOB|nr:aspartate aminotransferase family protein [Sedimentitalea todarodis]MDU9003947.1 aspartate aminotransferase family protein [Sedimentitalea todarodis]
MTFQPNSPEARDVAYHIHSYTDARSHQEDGPLIIERGDGAYVIDSSGNRYLEGMAGLWSVGVGFNEPRLAAAAAKQMEKLPFYHTFGGRSHGPAIDLAEKLIRLAPVPMSKVFFTNSGSEANDSVLKLLWYRSNAMGKPQRKKIISRLRGYHGVTIASASMTGLPINHTSFDLPIANVLHTGCPHHYRDAHDGESEEDFATRLATELEEMIEAEGPETVMAFIAEPVMGAGGIVVPPETYWAKIQAVLRKYDILLVADEVICGFGRTGQMFGSQTFDMQPDVMVMSKQITSSYFPFSAFMINDKVFEPLADESNRIGVLGHGFTGAGHPTGAAIALENLKIIEERDLVANAAEVGAYLREHLNSFRDHPLVGEVRGVGLLAAMELVLDKQEKTAAEKPGQLGKYAADRLFAHGVISRPMVDALAFCPPMIVNRADIDGLIGALRKSLDETAKAFDIAV